MTNPSNKLPSFRKPPVVETILGVQFVPVVRLKGYHAGTFWSELGPEWPNVEEQPLLPTQFERLEQAPPLDLSFALDVGFAPPVRLRIRNKDNSGMIQVQRDRLHYNWLGAEGQEYPRYSTVRERFDDMLARFRRFLADRELGEIKPNQWEVTYVNRLPRGTVWTTPADHMAVMQVQGAPSVSNLQTESADVVFRFLLPNNRGRLHVESRQHPDEVRLTLTARGPATSLDEVGDGLDLGREAIVTAFAELTSADAQKQWEPV